MIKLRKVLSDESKHKRSRRNVLSIQITMLGWVVEWLGFLAVAVGSYILGSGNSNVTQILQTITILFYAVLLPCTILINSSEVKEKIAESLWYLNFITMCGCNPTKYFTPENDKAPIVAQVIAEAPRDEESATHDDSIDTDEEGAPCNHHRSRDRIRTYLTSVEEEQEE